MVTMSLRARLLALLAVLALPLPAQARGLEAQVLAELNYARAHPARYAEELAQGGWALRDEDPRVVDEAIGFLLAQRPLPPLRAHAGLEAAAGAHVRAQARRGTEGHGGGAGGLAARLKAQGVWAGLSAETISYGYAEAREVVVQLVVDSRVPGRGHRKTIFGAGYSLAGVACGPHAAYGAMCVIDFAGALAPR
ncbi:MAG: CAP domain-containing protein [Phenylobacterium sp.]|nr:CAP domain-containing protein [Phenylobacterium sp.]